MSSQLLPWRGHGDEVRPLCLWFLWWWGHFSEVRRRGATALPPAPQAVRRGGYFSGSSGGGDTSAIFDLSVYWVLCLSVWKKTWSLSLGCVYCEPHKVWDMMWYRLVRELDASRTRSAGFENVKI